MWRKRSACSFIAATTLGWEWPVVTTAIPAVKSRNRLPSTSVTQQPLPRSMTNGYDRVKLGDIALASRAISSAAFGPGRGVLISGFTGGKHNGRDGPNKECKDNECPGEERQGIFRPRCIEGRPEGDRRHLQLGGEPDFRDHRLRAARRRGGAGVVGDAWEALQAPGLGRR